jgi:tetratricopeptide (TPR) repeat protein
MSEKVRADARSRPPHDYDDVFDRLEQRLVQGTKPLVPAPAGTEELYAELLDHQAVEGLFQVHSTRRFASLSLCELLLKKSRDLTLEDPGHARRAADLASAITEHLDLELYGAPVVQDTQAIAWAYMAETSRVSADLRTAETSLKAAGRLLEQEPGDPLIRAELLTLQASLRAYGGGFERALGLLNRAASIHRRVGDRHLLGRTLLKKATVLGNAGRPGAAARLIRRSLELIDPPREPRLLVCAAHNAIWFLAESGQTSEASAWLQGARRLYQQAGDRRQLGRLRWLEGKLAPSLSAAEGALADARESLSREGLPYEAALAAMDLAVLYANEGRGTAMRRQADQMLPFFRSETLYRETVMALLSFQQNAGQRAPAELIGEVRSYLDRTRGEMNPPGLARRLTGRTAL